MCIVFRQSDVPGIAEGGMKLFKLLGSGAAFGNTMLDAVVSCPNQLSSRVSMNHFVNARFAK
jgi:hypothetical protein